MFMKLRINHAWKWLKPRLHLGWWLKAALVTRQTRKHARASAFFTL